MLIDTRKDAVYVPLQCVFLEGGKQWCYVLDASKKPQKGEVKPGLSNDSYLEVIEGLAEGQQVLLYNPSVPTGAAPEQKQEENGEKKPEEAPAASPPPGNAGATPMATGG